MSERPVNKADVAGAWAWTPSDGISSGSSPDGGQGPAGATPGEGSPASGGGNPAGPQASTGDSSGAQGSPPTPGAGRPTGGGAAQSPGGSGADAQKDGNGAAAPSAQKGAKEPGPGKASETPAQQPATKAGTGPNGGATTPPAPPGGKKSGDTAPGPGQPGNAQPQPPAAPSPSKGGEGAVGAAAGAGAAAAGADPKQLAAEQLAAQNNYLDAAMRAQKLADVAREQGAAAAAEDATVLATKIAVDAALDSAGGARQWIDKVPGAGQAVDSVSEKLGRTLFKVGAVAVSVGMSIAVAVLVLVLGVAITVSSMSGGPTLIDAPKPTQEQCESMPDGWCDVLYSAQVKAGADRSSVRSVPWTVLAGITRVATDYGRWSPYDTDDRFPDRTTPKWLAANFKESETSGGDKAGSVWTGNQSQAWGGHSNGRIPEGELCSIPWAPQHKLRCDAAEAMASLNEAYKSDPAHNGANIGFTSSYRTVQGQHEARAMWCRRGACSNAAVPGTSNHGWATTVDLANFGGIGDFNQPNYKWMKKNASRFGWYHPQNMEPGGKGPQEPWHWEYYGVAADGGATQAASVAFRTNGSVSAGVNASSCAVGVPSPAIGGTGEEAAGPFLIRPGSQTPALKSLDPNSPCDAAEIAAKLLQEAADAEVAENGEPAWNASQDEMAAWWQKVIQRSGAFADPDVKTGQCLPSGTETPVGDQIDEVWHCVLATSGKLNVVRSAAVSSEGDVEYKTFGQSAAIEQLISEAKAVAWASSRWGENACKETDDVAGVFPLTAAEAAKVGLVERCDVGQNIRAAADLVAGVEVVEPAGRTTELYAVSVKDGVYLPMLGGWGAIAAAVGPKHDTFSSKGPWVDWEPDVMCTAAIESYVSERAQSAVVMAELANVTVEPADTAKYSKAMGSLKKSVGENCGSARKDQLAAHAATEVLAQMPDVPEEGATETPTGEDVEPAVPVEDVLRGMATWFGWQVSDAPEVPTAALGEHSLVARLSPTETRIATALSSAASKATFEVTGWQERATEWAIFYGGVTLQWNSHGERTGTLKSSLNGSKGSYASSMGSTDSQVKAVLAAARTQIGVPYVWGGGNAKGPTSGQGGGATKGFDCSGLMMYAFGAAGYELSHSSRVQGTMGTTISGLDNALPGDMLFFGSPKITHVALYAGDNTLIHAPKPGDVVKEVPVYATPVLIKRIIEPRKTEGNVDEWVDAALKVLYANGMAKDDGDVDNLKLIIDKESSGNPDAVNKSDSNWVAGHPSFGLMQTIPSTFEAHALKGYKDKSDPVAQIIAGARYATSRYGSLAQVPGVKAVKNGRPYVGY